MKDPVCGMDVQDDRFTLQFEGRKFYFCSSGDLEKFKDNPKGFADKYTYDLIIVGAGPAGLTACVYASLLRMSTFLITENIGGQPVDNSKIVNYMGFDFISGPQLVQLFRKQLLEQHYIDHLIDSVSTVEKKEDAFLVSTASGKKYESDAVIVATGMQRAKLGVHGEERLLRRGVFYAFAVDPNILAGKPMAIIGGGNSALQAALEFAKYRCPITIISKGSLTADLSIVEQIKQLPDLTILDSHEVAEIKGEDKVESVIARNLKNNEETLHAVNSVLIAVGQTPNSHLVRSLVDLTEKNEIVIAADCSTDTPGLFACGDVTSLPDKRIVIASGEGAKAALAARRHIFKLTPYAAHAHIRVP